MIWASFMQAEIVPPGLAQPAIAVALVWLVLQIVKEVRQMISGRDRGSSTVAEDKLAQHRFLELEVAMKERITRTEYESRDKTVRDQLNRIETLLQRMWTSRALFMGKDPEG